MADYPGEIHSPRTMTNRSGEVYDAAKTRKIFAEDFNKDRAEIVAVETELGTNPKGIYASVKANLVAIWEAIAGFAASFLDLSDTPESYDGQAGKVALVNAEEDGLEFGEAGAGELKTVRHYIAMRADTSYISSTSTTYASQGAFVRFNKAMYPNLLSIKFAAKIYTAAAGGVAYAKLKNQSTGVEVVQSEVSHNGTNSWDVSCFKISADVKDNIADNENTYVFRMKTNDAAKAARLMTAYIIVEYQVYA